MKIVTKTKIETSKLLFYERDKKIYNIVIKSPAVEFDKMQLSGSEHQTKNQSQ